MGWSKHKITINLTTGQAVQLLNDKVSLTVKEKIEKALERYIKENEEVGGVQYLIQIKKGGKNR